MKKEFLKKTIIIGMTTLIITSLSHVSASAKWVDNGNDNWNWTEDGIKATGWEKIDNKWYYFDDDGTMLKGWIKYSKNWYSLSDDGSMNIGWKEIEGKWYHLGSDGKMDIGWINDNGTLYYTNSSGEMVAGNTAVDGVTYNFSDNGQLLDERKPPVQEQSQSENTDSVKNDDNSRMAYVATQSDSLNVRSEASTSSDIIGSLTKGSQIKIIGNEKDGFYPMIMNEKKGWVSSNWISFSKSEDNVVVNNTNNNGSLDSKSGANSSTNQAHPSNADVKLNGYSLGAIRDTAPSTDNEKYYSDDNLFYKVKLSPPFMSGGRQIKGNCTWYAWGRAWELTGVKPTDAGFIGNAYEWWEANKKSGKFQYGSEPRVGSIAVWKSNLPNSGGDGHVAIVEKIEDGKIYISESTWNGVTFRYRELYEPDYLYGYIYLDKPNY